MQFTWIIMKEILWMLGIHQSPIYFAWINPTNSIILELWRQPLCLLKMGFLVTYNINEGWKVIELKTGEEWIFFFKLEFRKIIRKLEFWKIILRIEN